MLKRFISLITICVLLVNIVIINGCTSKKNVAQVNNNDSNVQLTKSNNGDSSATAEFEGSVLKATYEKNSDTYKLYRDNIAYNVNVSKNDENVVIDVDFDNPKVAQNKDVVVAQNAAVISILFWSAEAIAVATGVISAVVVGAVAVGTAVVVWYAADTIAQAIEKSVAKAKTKPNKQPPSTYYRAGLIGGKVVIAPKAISYAVAVATLKSGFDVFATNNNAAYSAALGASKSPLLPKWDKPHIPTEGYYPHWHPGGVKSIKVINGFTFNPNAAPHCWYPVS